jgi:hypothetical protein
LMSNIRIDIASEFKDKGFKAAERRTTSLTRKFDNLTRTARRTFIAIAGFQALKRSVTAFAEEDRAAQKLATSLRNLGLAYNTKAIEDYLEQSEKATAINKDQLSPAISLLISTTLDAQKSMTLLNLAMDISTATGKDLNSVTMGLTRAYNGNYAALGKVQTAYTAAELKALGFEASVKALSEQFAGAAQQNATTYSGKIELLRIAFEDLAEEIGKGIVAFLTSLGSGDYDKGLQKLVNFGAAIGDAFRRAGLTIEYTKALLSTGFRIDEEEMRKLEEIRNRFQNPQAATNRAANNPAANRAFLADLRKQQALQKKIEADRKKAAALAAKAEQERLKREKEAAQLKRAGTVFDLENIQIVAAMQGKIDGDQRLRLTALLALNTGVADAAEKAAKAVLATNAPALANLGVIIQSGDSIDAVIKKILDAQAKLALVDLGIKDIPKAKNPFEDWFDIINRILTELGKVKVAVATISSPSAPIVSPTTPAATATSTLATALTTPAALAAHVTDLTAMRQDVGVASPLGVKLKEQIDEYSTILKDSFGTEPVDELSKRRAMNAQTNITVNVQGTVISEGDLAETLINELYRNQRNGQGLLLSSVAI